MDLIDFISTALKDDVEKKLGNLFVQKIKAGDAKELLNWFHSLDYKGVSLDDCEKLIKNQASIIHNAEVSLTANY